MRSESHVWYPPAVVVDVAKELPAWTGSATASAAMTARARNARMRLTFDEPPVLHRPSPGYGHRRRNPRPGWAERPSWPSPLGVEGPPGSYRITTPVPC